MKYVAPRAAAILAVTLLLTPPQASAGPDAAALSAEAEDFQWAQGRFIDSIYVVGNTDTRSFAILREMESRVGHRLDPEAVARDERFLTDLSSFAVVDITVEPVGVDRCVLRVDVTERPMLLVKLVYPILEYDFNNERLRYGAKWRDRNFRNRLESFSLDVTRNSVKNDNAAISWSSPWVGWKHVGVGGRLSYFHRNETPDTRSVVEQTRFSTGVSLPLTDSRIAFAEVIANVGFERNRLASTDLPSDHEVLVTPLVGFRFDRRDSRIRPTEGYFFFVSSQTSRVISGEGSTYHRLTTDARYFHSLNGVTVIGLYSNLSYQFGKFPEFLRFGLGGSGTLRGYSDDEFRGAHRWIQTAEARISPLPQWFFQLPFVGTLDVTASFVLFVDGGIAWDDESSFTADNLRGGFGYGLRVYSPLQDVVRFDLGFNRRGAVHPYFSTGIRF
jgi:outer membrane protein insertion porin family